MTGNVPVVAEQFVVPLHDAPGCDTDADNASGPLLAVQDECIADLFRDTCAKRKK